jgi:hypothetical protein
MDENKQKEALQSQIESAMQQGASLNEIIDHLSSSEDVLHQQFAKRLRGEEVQDETYRMRQQPKEEITTPLVNTASGAATSFSNLPVEQQIGYGLAGVAGLGGLGLATYAGKEYLRNKISNANINPQFERQNDIAARNVALEEKKLEMSSTVNGIEQARIDVEKAKAERIRDATRRDQELHQQKIIQMGKTKAKESLTTPPVDIMLTPQAMTTPEIQQSTGFTGLNEFEKNKGVFAENQGKELKMALQSENNAALKAGQDPIYNALLSEQAKQKLAEAKAAGVTPMTSEPEAQTLIATKENSQTPPEKLEQAKAPLPEQIIENKTGIAPKTIADIQQQEKLNPLFQKHLIQQQELLKDNTQFTNALQKAYESGKIQPNEFFVPGLGNMDKNVFNTLGPEGRRQALEYKGKTAYGEVKGADYNDVVSKNINDYAESLKKEIPADLTTRQSRIAQGLPHEKNYGTLGKTMRVGGVAGLAMTVAELANAKTPQERREALRGLGDAILPPSMTSTELAPATLPANAYTESRKLGSPFYKMFKEGAAPPSMR